MGKFYYLYTYLVQSPISTAHVYMSLAIISAAFLQPSMGISKYSTFLPMLETTAWASISGVVSGKRIMMPAWYRSFLRATICCCSKCFSNGKYMNGLFKAANSKVDVPPPRTIARSEAA